MHDPPISPGSRSACVVLIVPHCWDCGDSLRMLLCLRGLQAEIVRGGDASIQWARAMRPRLVLLDINLPEDDGWEVARRFRQAFGDDLRLIGLAKNGWDGDTAAWSAAGFDGWLRKPVDPDEVLRLLKGV